MFASVYVSVTSSVVMLIDHSSCWFFFFQAEDGIRDLVRSRGLGDVYKRQGYSPAPPSRHPAGTKARAPAR